MDQRRTFHAARKGDDVLRADDVRAQAALERGIESNVAGGVDDDVDIVGDGLCFFFAVAEVRLGDVAASDDDLVADETFERAAVTFAQRIERRRGDDVVPEAILRLFLRTRAHGEIDLARRSGKRCSNMLSVTLPRKPVLPIRKIFRSL